MKGLNPPETFAEADKIDHQVPKDKGENHCRNTFAQAGHPAPCANPFKNQRMVNNQTDSLWAKAIVAKPDRKRPLENKRRDEQESDKIPPKNLLIAYARFWLLMINPVFGLLGMHDNHKIIISNARVKLMMMMMMTKYLPAWLLPRPSSISFGIAAETLFRL